MTTSLHRPFKVLGIQQVAIGGTDKQRMKTLWVDMLGLTQTGTFQSERENVDEDILAMGQGAYKVEVDIMQPLDIDKKPAVHTTPLNHIGLWIQMGADNHHNGAVEGAKKLTAPKARQVQSTCSLLLLKSSELDGC